MKIALVTSSAPFGPGESFVVVEANALVEQRVELVLVPTHIRSKVPRKIKLDTAIKVISHGLLSFTVFKTFIWEIVDRPIPVMRAFYMVLSWQPVILVKNLMVLPKAVWLATLVKDMNIQHIHAQWVSTPSTVAMVASSLSGVPWSFTAHRGDIVDNNLLCKKMSSASFSRFIAKKSIELAENICAPMSSEPKLLHMGVLMPKFQKKGQIQDKFVFLCPASLTLVKGHQYLIKAFSSLRDKEGIELWLAGSGPLKSELEALVENSGLTQTVKFLGEVTHSDLLDMYAEAKVNAVVLPSLDLGNGVHEGIPVSLMEAMSYGIPVISTSTGGIPELLYDGAGVIVLQSSAIELAKAINKLRFDLYLYKQVSDAGRQRIVEQFNLEVVTKRLVSWFEENSA